MTNVDHSEIAKFEAIANRWWDPEGEFKPLHDINPLRLNYINERAPLAGRRVLDVGCGGGILSEGLALRGARVTGIDLGAANLDVARDHAASRELEIDYRHLPVEELAAAEHAGFDVVTCMELLEHVPDPAAIIHACAALTKPGGQLFFSTINRNPKAYALAIVGAEYVMNLVPKGTHDYLKFIKPSELAAWARQAGIIVSDLSGMSVNPLTMQFKLSRDLDVNYFMHCRKPA
ncbi:MAG: bifunctional 2-polyprenyl-6-hydroxyphenol methylase/3-demethylubiquinol 3-O-methyltransferase UbiG [Pseudomonadota bacterium]|nr:bifunctional 3-demethylubiquinol 3-O-methyltransferase/2-polyprenyl-6-hydroxyphenol methylase [Pseudomonadales bacterium]MDY6920687.1 bifunctional 2-polyprenyl-6-hydroxyphenol methylase/3-demethylubiquinol 3-O-methyltransferase UbiG [Pseudomonadota bacterium]